MYISLQRKPSRSCVIIAPLPSSFCSVFFSFFFFLPFIERYASALPRPEVIFRNVEYEICKDVRFSERDSFTTRRVSLRLARIGVLPFPSSILRLVFSVWIFEKEVFLSLERLSLRIRGIFLRVPSENKISNRCWNEHVNRQS